MTLDEKIRSNAWQPALCTLSAEYSKLLVSFFCMAIKKISDWQVSPLVQHWGKGILYIR